MTQTINHPRPGRTPAPTAPTATAKPSVLASPPIAPDCGPDQPAANVRRPAAKPATRRRALITVRERFPGEAVTSIRYPAGAREWVFLSGPHFNIEHDPGAGRSWYGAYLKALQVEFAELARKLGFDEFEFKVTVPHCHRSATYSVYHEYPIS
jgi:hypothetical protein